MPLPRGLRVRIVSGSVVEARVAFVRFSWRQFAIGFRGSSGASMLRRVLVARTNDLHRGPDVERRAVDRNVVARDQVGPPRGRHNALEEDARYVGLEDPVLVLRERRGVEVGSDMSISRNQRNSRLSSSCSQNYGSLRTPLSAFYRYTFGARSVGVEGRPVMPSIASNCGGNFASSASALLRAFVLVMHECLNVEPELGRPRRAFREVVV